VSEVPPLVAALLLSSSLLADDEHAADLRDVLEAGLEAVRGDEGRVRDECCHRADWAGRRRPRRRPWSEAPPRAVAPLQRKACKSASSQAPPRAPQRRRGEAEYGFLPPARVNRAFLRHWTRPASNGCDSGDVAIRREGRFAQKWATTGSVCDRDVRYVGKIGEFAVGPRARYLVVITRKGVIDGR
jgi:hypothetical protein